MKRVLLVNDCRFESIIISDILDSLGYDVKITNEYEAMRELRDFLPDIVIANLIMKTTTGDVLIEKIKNYDEKILGVVSSCNDLSLKSFVHKRVDAILHTPASKDKIIEALTFTERAEEDKVNAPSIKFIEKAKTVIEKKEFDFCPYCGAKFEEEQKQFLFCPHCGHKLA